MKKSVRAASWAVYQGSVQGEPGPNVVCSQAEWDALRDGRPGAYRLIRDGITNEGEAERLARGASGDDKPRVAQRKTVPNRASRRADLTRASDQAPAVPPFTAATRAPGGISESA